MHNRAHRLDDLIRSCDRDRLLARPCSSDPTESTIRREPGTRSTSEHSHALVKNRRSACAQLRRSGCGPGRQTVLSLTQQCAKRRWKPSCDSRMFRKQALGAVARRMRERGEGDYKCLRDSGPEYENQQARAPASMIAGLGVLASAQAMKRPHRRRRRCSSSSRRTRRRR